ncbi:MAG: AAA family ATPase [Lachnospiraceae bacterium]|nr:AAA family ATPase [Lachnospiraceae bacterium]
MCKVIAVVNQKGGVGKTTTTANLGVGLEMKGKHVLLIDADAQGDLTMCMGYNNPDRFEKTLTTILKQVIEDELENPFEAVIHNEEGIDLIPCNIELSGMEVSLVNVMGREYILKQYLEQVKDRYDYILIDCSPSLGMVTINALAAADSVLIPVEAEYLPAKGLEQLIKTIRKTRNKINPKLEIEGILMTMVDERTNLSREIMDLIQVGYDSSVRVFETKIPKSIRAAESTVLGTSIFQYDMKSKVAGAYKRLVKEVLGDA